MAPADYTASQPEEFKRKLLEYCPTCTEHSLFWDQTNQIWECLNLRCKRIYTSSEFSEYLDNKQVEIQHTQQRQMPKRIRQVFDAPLWLVNILESKRVWSLLICFAVSWCCWTGMQYSSNSLGQMIGLTFPILLLYIIRSLLRRYLNNYNTLAMRHTIFPRFYAIRKSYFLRLCIILVTIALLTTAIWSIYSLVFNIIQNASLAYLLDMTVLIAAQIWLLNWLCRTLRHSRYISRKPRFAAVFWAVFAGIVFCAFVGIHPLSDVKDNAITSITDWWGQTTIATKPPVEPPAKNLLPAPPDNPTSSSTIYETNKEKYPNRVWTNDYTYVTSTSSRPIELYENPNAKNPTWDQLLSFLRMDKTDEMTYLPDSFVCADFAETLHNNAEKAGIRSGFVVLYFDGIDKHACNAFQTVDKGLVFIDDTGLSKYQTGPGSADKIVNVQTGTDYTPRYIFSNPVGNTIWTVDSMGTVARYQICWKSGSILDYQYDYNYIASTPSYVPPYVPPPSSTPILPSYVPPYIPPPTPSISVPVCRSCCEDRCSKYQGLWHNGCIDDCMKGGTDKWSWK